MIGSPKNNVNSFKFHIIHCKYRYIPLSRARNFEHLRSIGMPPIRRYLRVTRYTVLEVRIHLDDPAQLTWLLRGANPALPRIILAIRPLVLPKLREENERARGKTAAKKRGVKDTVTQGDFEVSMFLTDSSTRHQLLTKTKEFTTTREKGTLTGWLGPGEISKDKPVATSADEDIREVIVIRAESPDGHVNLADIPSATGSGDDDDGSEDDERVVAKPANRAVQDDKKLAPRTTYGGFSIYGRVLCLVIKRTSVTPAAIASSAKLVSGPMMMENWVSTQAANGELSVSTELI